MRKTRAKILTIFFACVLFCIGLVTLAACGGSKNTLESISVTKMPNKIVYVAGSEFDPAGMEITASYSNGSSRVLESTEYTYKAPSIKVPSSRFETTKSVTVTYTEGDATQRTSFEITITNKVTAVNVTTQPNKTQYYSGEHFDPLGLKISATYQDGSTVSDVAISDDNATFSQDAITSGMNSVSVTYGGYAFNIDITVKNGLYLEAENGLLNGEEVPKISTGADGGNYGVLELSTVQDGVKSMYGTHLAQLYGQQLAEIKKVELAADDNVADKEGALAAYLNSDEYKALLDDYSSTKEYKNAMSAYENGTNEDIAQWNYSADIARYKANNSAFLGDINKGDEVSYSFEADKAGSGKIALRMSSTWLLGDNGYWTPNEIGGVQVNKLFELYVNGEKVDISDDVTLEGCKTKDGSYNSLLWTNWNEVEFNISFVAGRNVLVLKALNHDYVSPVHSDNKAVPNIDSLVIIPNDEDVSISVYDHTKYFKYDITSVELVEETGVQVKIHGTLSVQQGYVADLIVIKLGAVRADNITVENGVFVATIDVSEFEANVDGYGLTVDVNPVMPSDSITVDTEITASYGYKTYGLSTQNVIKLIVGSGDYSVQMNSVTIVPAVKLEEQQGKPYIVIGGGSYDYTAAGFDESDVDQKAEINRWIAKYIKEYYLFEAELNPDASANGVGGWGEKGIINGTQSVNLLDGNQFEIVCELSSLKVGGGYGVHFNVDGAQNKDLNSTNFPSLTKLDSTSIIVGRIKYEASYDNRTSWYNWDCLSITVSDARTFSYDSVALAQEENDVFVVINGSYEYYTEDEINARFGNIKADYTYHTNFNTSALRSVNFTSDDIATTVTAGANGGTYTINLKLTDKTVGTAFFHLDFSSGTTNFRCELAQDSTTVTSDDRKFTLYITSNTHTNSNWAEGLVGLRIESVEDPDTPIVPEKSYDTAAITGIESEDGKVYIVVTGDCTGYTESELKDLIILINFENSNDSNHKVEINAVDAIVTVADGKYTVKCEISSLPIIGGGYFVHMKPFGNGENGDIYRSGNIEPLIYNGNSYFCEDKTVYGWTGNVIKIVDVKRFNGPEKAEFVTEDNKIYYAVTFSTENMSLDQIKAKITKIDLELFTGDYSQSQGRTDYEGENLIFGNADENGKVVVKIDISGLTEGVYVPHYFVDGGSNGTNLFTDDNSSNAVAQEMFDSKIYEVKQTTILGGWTAYLLNVSNAE